jgi:hypothetical protein
MRCAIVLLLLLIGCHTASKPRVEADTPVQKLRTSTEVFELRSKCAAFGEKILNEHFIGSALSQSQTSHYNPKTNRCYVELTVQTADTTKPLDNFSRSLFDGQTGEVLTRATINKGAKWGMVYVRHEVTSSSFFDDANAYIDKMMSDDRNEALSHGSTLFPDWLTQPESQLKIVLFLLSPGYVWLAKKLGRRISDWHALRSERAARISLTYLKKSLTNPPTLLESIAYLVCFLPIPIALTMMYGSFYFDPLPPPQFFDRHTAEYISRTFAACLFFVNYLLFGLLTAHGVQVAYRLRHGEARYADNYKAATQRRIDRLKRKYPQLLDE